MVVGEHYTIISKNNCHWCTKAKAMLNYWGITYQEFNIDELPKDHWARVKLKDEELKTVPQIWDGPYHIGGYTDLDAYLAGD